MLLYSLVVSEESDCQKEISMLREKDIVPVVAKNAAQAMNVLTQDAFLIHFLLIDARILLKEPLFISQIRMLHQYRHIAITVYGHHNLEQPIVHEGFSIYQKEDLFNLITSFTEYAHMLENRKFDIGLLSEATFQFKTLEQGYLLAQFLSHQFPLKNQCLVGITELFINAVEHGNLQISYEDKSALLAIGRWTEEVQQRLQDPLYKDRYVTVHFSRDDLRIEIIVEDCGQGFDWKTYEKPDPRRLLASHGRGIMMAKSLSFSNVCYEGSGNRVRAVLDLKEQQS